MQSAFRAWIALLLLLVIILLSISTTNASESELARFKRQSSTGRRNCDCRYASDSPLCASNGISYPSECRFNCARARNSRLRIISSGTCNGKSLSDFRRGQKRS